MRDEFGVGVRQSKYTCLYDQGGGIIHGEMERIRVHALHALKIQLRSRHSSRCSIAKARWINSVLNVALSKRVHER
jgi:hypothetical protein